MFVNACLIERKTTTNQNNYMPTQVTIVSILIRKSSIVHFKCSCVKCILENFIRFLRRRFLYVFPINIEYQWEFLIGKKIKVVFTQIRTTGISNG